MRTASTVFKRPAPCRMEQSHCTNRLAVRWLGKRSWSKFTLVTKKAYREICIWITFTVEKKTNLKLLLCGNMWHVKANSNNFKFIYFSLIFFQFNTLNKFLKRNKIYERKKQVKPFQKYFSPTFIKCLSKVRQIVRGSENEFPCHPSYNNIIITRHLGMSTPFFSIG